MFRFESPIYLWLLLLIPLLLVVSIWLYSQRKKKLRKFGDPELLRALMPDVSRWRPAVKLALMLAALALLIIMVARPQMGTKISREKRQGIETIIALDISNSMLCEDVTPTRLQKSKLLVENLVDHFTNDKIGLVVFAGDAFVQLPITSDYVSAKMFLQSISPSLIATQGTDIAQAIRLSMNSFTQDRNIGKAIILITDGEDHEGGGVEAAEDAHKKGINVFILGVGSARGAPIPMEGGVYMTDNTGETVITALNEQMCQEVARAGKGTYIHVDNNSDAQKRLDHELDKLQHGETESVVYSEYDEQFQAFGILALLLLLIEILILEIKNPMFKNMKLFKGRFLLIGILGLMPLVANAQLDRQYVRTGNRFFKAQAFDKAEAEYRKALTKNPSNPQALYNLGCALMAQQQDSAAMVQFDQAGKIEQNKLRRAKAFHNMGWICQRHQLFDKAIEAYKESLRNNPDDNETRYNLALCQYQRKQQPPQQQPQNQDNKDQQGNDQKQENQQQEDQSQDNQQPQPKDKMSQENAEQLLNAALQQEKQTQERMKKQQPRSRNLQKQW
ncbi:MAG: VWA domain-containing protein [Prevotella sp.]|nr:VWA domain-containing protein [Prevotella sp.]